MKGLLPYSLFAALLTSSGLWGQNRNFNVVETGIPEMRAAMEQHRITRFGV